MFILHLILNERVERRKDDGCLTVGENGRQLVTQTLAAWEHTGMIHGLKSGHGTSFKLQSNGKQGRAKNTNTNFRNTDSCHQRQLQINVSGL
jgi:hypothetical protein